MVEVGGSRLALARFRESDSDAVHGFASDPAVCAFTTWGPNTDEDTRDFIAEATEPMSDGYVLAVILGEVAIGSAAVWTSSRSDRTGEFGYTIRRDYWGRGFGTEVAILLLRLGFGSWVWNERLPRARQTMLGRCVSRRRLGCAAKALSADTVLVRGRRWDSLIFGCFVTDS